ncbi:hypothetical protein FACS1894162_7540 [Bacteroidia bacterium]|nr:hypothetical protein FACS1894162_7540 [Bacteroidia bacterium]
MPRSTAAYTIYGHTALRVQNPADNMDVVFNWGTFDFQAPNFLYRFVKGETDYFLSYTDYNRFLFAYAMDNSTIIEQKLNLPSEGKAELFRLLSINVQPENLVYRYDFLFDNCTTRVRDLIETGTENQLSYKELKEPVTFRQLIHSCTAPYPWMTFGIDLLVGSGSDSLIHTRQSLFLPANLMKALDDSPFVISSEEILTATSTPASKSHFWESPMIAGWRVFILGVICCLLSIKNKIPFRIYSAILFLIAGITGCIVLFVTMFSYHPCTSPNWNILWLHPLHFIGFAGCFFKRLPRWITWYHGLNFVVLAGLLIGWCWVPQGLNAAGVPYILCLGLISGVQIKFLYRT